MFCYLFFSQSYACILNYLNLILSSAVPDVPCVSLSLLHLHSLLNKVALSTLEKVFQILAAVVVYKCTSYADNKHRKLCKSGRGQVGDNEVGATQTYREWDSGVSDAKTVM